MSSGADLFVVCKQCGSEVSPYITECPYCGHRLRRRAPKLPRERLTAGGGGRRRGRLSAPSLGRLRRGEIAGVRGEGAPLATIALVLGSAAVWIATRGGYVNLSEILVVGPLHGEWWRLLSYQFGYGAHLNGTVYLFAALLAIAVFGSLVERRHGAPVALALFLGAGVTGALAAEAVYPFPVASGAAAGALGLLGAWAVPDIQAARAREYYDGDLLGTGTFALVLLAMPFAYPPASWLAGVTGAVFGLLAGLGLARVRAA